MIYIFHLIQIWIRLKKLDFHGKWQNLSLINLFQHLLSAEIYLNEKLNLYWNICEKFPNQCKEQTNSNVSSNIFLLCKASSWIWWLSLYEKYIRLSNVYNSLQIYVCFLRLENLVYQNNLFIIILQSNLFKRPPLQDEHLSKMANAESAQANSHTIITV